MPHVLVLCALILASGVVSVGLWHGEVSGALHAALVLVDDPSLTATEAEALAARFSGRVESVVTSGRILDPFDVRYISTRRDRDEWTILYALEPGTPRGGWGVVLDRTRDPVPLLRDTSLVDHVMDEVRDSVRSQRALSAFVIGLTLGKARQLDGGRRRDIIRLLEPLVDDLEGLPPFRRASLVVLGPPEPARVGWTRRCVRVDTGPWRDVARPALADLLRLTP